MGESESCRPVVVKRCLLLAAMLTISSSDHRLFGQGPRIAADGDSPSLRLSDPLLLSNHNRKQDGVAFGGWGPHLRSILRMNDDSLWYVMDHSKGDVSSNDKLIYLRRQGESWNRVAEQELIPGANQGFAHVTNGEEIFSYGVNFRLARLHECRFDSKTFAPRVCSAVRNASGEAIRLGGGANYVGAAISPKGTRLVWWVVVTPDGSQQWRYVFNRGGVWHGPVVTHLPKGRGGLSYIYVRFATESSVALSGQLWEGEFPAGSPRATLTHFRLGQPVEGFHTLKSSDEKGFPKSGSDLWIDRDTATVHAVVESFGDAIVGSKVHYYTFNLRDAWRDLKPVRSFDGYFRARFTQVARGDLLLVLGGNSGRPGIDILHVRKDSIANPVDWSAASRIAATMPGKMHYAPTAIWVENRAYQTTAVRNLNFAFTGEYPQRDHEVWFYSGTFR